MITIYFQTNRLVITSAEQDFIQASDHPECLLIRHADYDLIASLCRKMVDTDKDVVLLVTDEKEALHQIKQQFSLIQAGGGFVYTPEKEILLIFRRGKWDLPKGKLDAGETIQKCAVREVQEETGVAVKEIGELLLTTYHHYVEQGKAVLKESFWYLMPALKQTLILQTEEDIEKGEWANINDLAPYLANTYPLIKDVIIKAQEMLS